jgi:alpha-glucosidase (family GH31 glycosyl hydrolase)
MKLTLLPGENWWSGCVADGDDMPYGSFVFARDLRSDIGHNQANPVLLSSRGRYVWSESPFRFRIEDLVLAADDSVTEIFLDRYGSSLREAFLGASGSYFPSTGDTPHRAMFDGPQYNTWIELVYGQTQDRILDYAKQILANGFPPGVLMIDDNWQEDYGVWDFHPGRFPEPRAMMSELHALGFTVMLWTCPFVSADSATYRDLESRGYLLKDGSGTTAVRRWWNGISAVLDLTNPATASWYHQQLARLQTTFGIDGFKFDAGDPRFYEQSDQAAVSQHPNAHCESWAAIGLSYPLNEFRACWRLAGKPLVQRLKDTAPTWRRGGLASLIPHGIAQGLAGYAFNCPDMIGGGLAENFDDPTYQLDEELLVRWTQCAALFPMMQFSLAPWRVLPAEKAEYCREAMEVRAAFTPDILRLVAHAGQTGEPILRHLEYVFPNQGFARITDQFMLGDEVLVAPILTKGGRSRDVVFPPGTWIGDDASTVVGPCLKSIAAPLSRLPRFRLSTESVDAS